MPTLFDPLQLGDISLPNRVIMAPLTRCRADEARVPTELMQQYYVQRASAGLIITEATAVCPSGVGYPNTPGIWNQEQVLGWQKITDAVHQAGGRIVMQLWHVGRISDPHYLNGAQPVAPSAIAAEGHVSLLRPKRPYTTPKALSISEIGDLVLAYRQGAENAKAAGFDGVEIHGANGYLPDQFLQSSSNHRNDEYGGSIVNRARFLLEVTDAAIAVWGAGRVGVHLAPRCDAYGMGDADPEATFSYVASELGARKIAFICTREHYQAPALSPRLKRLFGGPLIANENLDLASAEALLKQGDADAAAFGVKYIANPDLYERFAQQAELNPADPKSFYSPGPDGYTDYPSLSAN